jgi:hypothetical protein
VSTNRPAAGTPARQPGSLRRTSTVTVTRVGDGLEMDARARDLQTDVEGDGHVIDEIHLEAVLDGTRAVRALAVDGEPATALDGVVVGPGFRRAADVAFPGAVGHLLGLLLDDLPIGTLLSGYAMVREQERSGVDPREAMGAEAALHMADICSGWRSDGVLVTSIRNGRGVNTQEAPLAGVLDDGTDPLAWHDVPVIEREEIRRTRRLDVRHGSTTIDVDAFFRDSYGELDGTQTVLHEYGLAVKIDAATLTVSDAHADAHVLPHVDCWDAPASARQLIGTSVADARRTVRESCTGISSCTHLNDLLVTLSSLPVLLETAQH